MPTLTTASGQSWLLVRLCSFAGTPVGQLAEQATDETIASLPRYSNYLRTLLPCKDAAVMTAAAAALGRLVSCGSGTMMASEIVEYEFGRCFEWIKEKNEHDMLAAMLLFKEFVQAVPSLVLPFITPLLEASWIPLTSAKVPPRLCFCLTSCRALL